MNTKYKGLMIAGIILGVIILFVFIIFKYYQNMYDKEVRLDQGVKKTWADVQASYQRRVDLIPNLVETVKGYAEHEQETLTEVMNARARATQITIDAGNLTPEKMAAFQQAQSGLSSALNKLMAVAENYPNLKADRVFIDMMASLEGTENRINKARRDYNAAVGTYNEFALKLMVKLILHPDEKPFYEAEAGADVAPDVSFTD
ncbi:MAG: LemA family protein [Bacteroidales bacterium]|nr:LemA family protein [Bacteroidales bacterium]